MVRNPESDMKDTGSNESEDPADDGIDAMKDGNAEDLPEADQTEKRPAGKPAEHRAAPVGARPSRQP